MKVKKKESKGRETGWKTLPATLPRPGGKFIAVGDFVQITDRQFSRRNSENAKRHLFKCFQLHLGAFKIFGRRSLRTAQIPTNNPTDPHIKIQCWPVSLPFIALAIDPIAKRNPNITMNNRLHVDLAVRNSLPHSIQRYPGLREIEFGGSGSSVELPHFGQYPNACCGNTEGFVGASARMVTTALHDGQLPCMPSAEAGSCFEKEQ